MVREHAGYGTDAAELVSMCRAAATFADLGVDGLVLGFARDGALLLDELDEVLQAAPKLPATFPRAFDSLDDRLRAIDALSAIPQIDRILTDGMPARNRLRHGYGESAGALAKAEGPAYEEGRPWLSDPAPDRCRLLREYSDRAGRQLAIIAGSGVDEKMLTEIARSRCVREVHIGRAARDGGQESPVIAARVRRLRATLNGLPELPYSPELP